MASPVSLRGSLLARFDHAEYRLCRRLNRGVEHTGIRVFFKIASRLGDGIIWYALMLVLPLIYGQRGLNVALIMLASGAAGLAVYKFLKRTFVRERPFIRYAGISLAGAPLDRYSFPSGHTLHAVAFTWQACAAFPELAVALVPLALAIATSRVVLGLHYPTDVLVGALLGAASGAIGTAFI
ncbi:MAG TPA: phosphatase PAP2 family protein [Steroidobacteraceae bacterium]|jgi:undecaprenyl-diphosphatase|nr:phosphatase PAP2 family protein [Steroidobacteraceae bacterium]